MSANVFRPKKNQSLVLSISLRPRCYRHIQISKSATLEELADAILDAFEFFNDHAHAFFMDNSAWSMRDCYFMAEVDEDEEYRHTSDYTLAKLSLQKGDAFKFVFDFGEDWRFQCKVLREEAEDLDLPEVIRAIGEAPQQYPDWDEEK